MFFPGSPSIPERAKFFQPEDLQEKWVTTTGCKNHKRLQRKFIVKNPKLKKTKGVDRTTPAEDGSTAVTAPAAAHQEQPQPQDTKEEEKIAKEKYQKWVQDQYKALQETDKDQDAPLPEAYKQEREARSRERTAERDAKKLRRKQELKAALASYAANTQGDAILQSHLRREAATRQKEQQQKQEAAERDAEREQRFQSMNDRLEKHNAETAEAQKRYEAETAAYELEKQRQKAEKQAKKLEAQRKRAEYEKRREARRAAKAASAA